MRNNKSIKLLLACVGIITGCILVTSGALAAVEFSETESETAIETSMSEMTGVILDCTLFGPGRADFDHLTIPGPISDGRVLVPTAETIVGIASFYDEPQETASGEQFDPDAFTAAAQLGIRDKFGGIRYGRNYQPAYAVAEYDGKKIILRFNDVGPLRPGRKFDLSRAAMAYFDGLEKGLLPDFKVTPLPVGQIFPAGPVTDAQLAALGIGLPPAEATGVSARLFLEEMTEDES